jgi:creatinine amidohydrolase
MRHPGPHAVLGGHTFIARSAAAEIARKLGNALVAPVLPFSPTDGSAKPQWPGTISVSTELYTKMNEAIVANMVVAGFKNIVLMGDHGGGQKQLEELAGSLDAKYRSQGVHVLYSAAAYAKARDDFDAILKEKNLPASNHAESRIPPSLCIWAGQLCPDRQDRRRRSRACAWPEARSQRPTRQ